MPETANRIREYVVNNELNEACGLLYSTSFEDEAVALQGKIKFWERELRLGRIEHDKYAHEINKARTHLLSIARELDFERHDYIKDAISGAEDNSSSTESLANETQAILDEWSLWIKGADFILILRYRGDNSFPVLDGEIVTKVCQEFPFRCNGRQEFFTRKFTEILDFIQKSMLNGDDITLQKLQEVSIGISVDERDLFGMFLENFIEGVNDEAHSKISTKTLNTIDMIFKALIEFYK